MGQMSLFSAGAREPTLTDLEGLLAGPGQVVRRSDAVLGDVGRVSVVIAAGDNGGGWRVEALLDEMSALGITGGTEPAEPGSVTVRTPWLAGLREVADRWSRGAVKIPPAGWALDGGRLRWWCLAAGAGGPGMYTLALGASDEPAWGAVGAALSAAGIAGVLVGPRADGPAYRIVGQRRLGRLRELVGEPPSGVPAEAWPQGPNRGET
jgi:hypothetical protein